MNLPLRLGARGLDEARVQRIIGVPADGVYGPITQSEVIAWQWARGLKADGIVGPITWDRMQAEEAADSDGYVTSGVPKEVFALSEAFEAFEPKPYQDSGGVWTIGIGSTRDLAGRPVTARTPSVTREQAEQMARRDLSRAADLLAQDFPAGLPARWWAVGVLANNNLGLMASWGPTLRQLLQQKGWRRAADQLKNYRNAGGKPLLGLRRRRWAEAAYALGLDAAEAKARAWSGIHTVDDWPPLP
jgi:lysozyme